MTHARWPFVFLVAVIGVIIGGAATVGVSAVDRQTSTDAFCTSCHSMAAMARAPAFTMSAHRDNAQGVQVHCVDCHLPATNLVSETYLHAKSGIRDILASWTHNYADPAVWEKRRVELASEVRNQMRADGSAACKSCHNPATIHPATEAGRAAHALMRAGGATCIDCHFNLVHTPVPASADFLRNTDLGGVSQ